MNTRKILAAAATITAAVALNTGTAAAAPGTCVVTFQPYDGNSYAAAAVVDGNVEHVITRQSGVLDNGPVSVTYVAPSGVVGDDIGVTQVWWSARNPARQNVAADYYNVFHVRPDCTFVEEYDAVWINGVKQQDSVTIRVATLPTVDPTTTTQPAPTTTSTTAVEPTTTTSTTVDLPPATTRPAPTTTHGTTPEPPSSTTSEVTTTTTEIVVDVPLVERPTTTTAPAPPEVPSSSTAPVEVDLYTATSVERHAGTLPVTGAAWLPFLVVAGCLSAMLGGLLAMFRPVRRRYAEVTK